MAINHKNFAETTLAAAITTTDGTSITVTSEASFPAVQFIISIDTEAMLVTTVDTVTWTVTRGYEGSTAATHLNGVAIYHDISAAEADAIATKLPLSGGTLTGNLVMDNMDVTLVKLLTLHGEIDDGNSGAADTIDWNVGAAHKSVLTGNVTLAFVGLSFAVPLMTSNTAPSGVASESCAGTDAFRAFSRNGGSFWSDNIGPTGWVAYDCGNGVTINPTAYSMDFHSTPYQSTAWKIQTSDDGTDWTDIDTRTGQNIGGTYTQYSIATPSAHRYWRFLSTAGQSSVFVVAVDFLFGVVNPAAPCFLTLKLVQDGTGGRTVTWPATVRGTPNLNAAASSTSIVLLYWDGTNYYVVNPVGTLANLGLDADLTTLALPANVTISAAGAELINDANAAAQLTTLGTAAYSEGTWTPTLYLFTIVGAAPAVSGTYKRIGNLVFAICKIAAGSGGNTSVASAGAGSNAISGLPILMVGAAVCFCSDDAADNLGTGVAAAYDIYPPAISAKTVPIYVAITYNA